MTKKNLQNEKVLNYDDIYKPGLISCTATIKIKIIQDLIQIKRPTDWTMSHLNELILKIIKIEKYNSLIKKDEKSFKKKWNCLLIDNIV